MTYFTLTTLVASVCIFTVINETKAGKIDINQIIFVFYFLLKLFSLNIRHKFINYFLRKYTNCRKKVLKYSGSCDGLGHSSERFTSLEGAVVDSR